MDPVAEESVLDDVFRWCDEEVRLNSVRSGGDWFSVESFAVVVGRVDGRYMRRFSTHSVIRRYWVWRKIMEYCKLTCCHVKLPFLSYFFIFIFLLFFNESSQWEMCGRKILLKYTSYYEHNLKKRYCISTFYEESFFFFLTFIFSLFGFQKQIRWWAPFHLCICSAH